MADTSTPQDPAAHWNERYASGAITWSGKVNDLLAPEVDDLAPGRVLDLGCGTGGDALWFAQRGWQVTAVDISPVAIEQAAGHAADAGVADRITFAARDLETDFPPGEFDLVSAPYLQSWLPFDRLGVLRAAAAAVAPGGRLVVVSHELVPSGQAPDPSNYMPTAAQLVVDLELAAPHWEVVRADTVPRQKTRPDGEVLRYEDGVVHARRAQATGS